MQSIMIAIRCTIKYTVENVVPLLSTTLLHRQGLYKVLDVVLPMENTISPNMNKSLLVCTFDSQHISSETLSAQFYFGPPFTWQMPNIPLNLNQTILPVLKCLI